MSKNIPIEAEKTEVGPCHYSVTVKVPGDRVTQEFDHAYKAAAQGVKIPGFRPGKAPVSVLRQMMGDGVKEHAKEHIFEHCSGDAIEALGLRGDVLRILDFDPEPYEVTEGEDLEFTFELETLPIVELPEWSELDVEPQDMEATDEQYQETLGSLGANHQKFDDVEDGAVDEELLADIDLVYELDGEAGPEAAGLKFGLGSPLYGADADKYDEALRGTKAGSEFELDVEFNEGFSIEDWVGKTGQAKIKVNKVVQPRVATEEELAEALGIESAEELRERVMERLGFDNQQRERDRQAAELLDSVVRLRPFEMPQRMIEEEAVSTIKSNMERMQQQGATEEQAKEEAAKHEDEVKEDCERRLKNWFVLRKIAQTEKIRVSKKDLDMAYRQLGAQQGVDVKMVKQYYKENKMVDGLRSDIMESKARAFLVDTIAAQREKAVASAE
ncbi:MAG: trigger factor [Planctomycetes bacterium]|nr:trigger factor [Planctomycetota bacterium]MCP4772263.1 trigger factor [Planctomycetota bacterium]MCP4861319.1 trigger factor [Planctomycetota bacterium]